jgi:hypothetical protein
MFSNSIKMIKIDGNILELWQTVIEKNVILILVHFFCFIFEFLINARIWISLKMIFSYCLLEKIVRHEAIIRAPNVCSELTFTCLIVFKTETSASVLTLRFVLEKYLVRTWPMLRTTLIEVSRDFFNFFSAFPG